MHLLYACVYETDTHLSYACAHKRDIRMPAMHVCAYVYMRDVCTCAAVGADILCTCAQGCLRMSSMRKWHARMCALVECVRLYTVLRTLIHCVPLYGVLINACKWRTLTHVQISASPAAENTFYKRTHLTREHILKENTFSPTSPACHEAPTTEPKPA